MNNIKLQSKNVSFVNNKTSKESNNSRIHAVFDLILNGKKEALAEMNYLDDYTDHYKQFEEEDDISVYSNEKFQRINSYVFIVPCISEASVLDELTGVY